MSGKTILLLLLVKICLASYPFSIVPNLTSDYQFRMVQNVPNTSDLVILGKGNADWKIGIFDAFETTRTSFPSVKDQTGSQNSNLSFDPRYLIQILDGVPGFPIQPPYKTSTQQGAIFNPTDIDPGLVLEPVEIQNNLPRQSLSQTERADLRAEIYCISSKAVAVGNRMVSFDTSRTTYNPDPTFEFNNTGLVRMGVNIALTDLVAASMYNKETLANFMIYVYQYGGSDYYKRFTQTRASESIGSKYGTQFLITTSFSAGQAYREIFDHTTTVDSSTRMSFFQTPSVLYPTLIGFPVTYGDILAQKGHPGFSFEDLFYTCDNGGPIKTFKFSDGSAIQELDMSLKTTSRAWSSDPITASSMVLIGYQQNYLVVVDLVSMNIVWDKFYPGIQGNFISQVSAFSLNPFVTFAAS